MIFKRLFPQQFTIRTYLVFLVIPGLALMALTSQKLRFPVRPKMHSLEHMTLNPYLVISLFCLLSQQLAWNKPTLRFRLGNFWVILFATLRILDFVPQRGNPRYYQCLLDEDMIRRASRWLTGNCFHFLFFVDYFYNKKSIHFFLDSAGKGNLAWRASTCVRQAWAWALLCFRMFTLERPSRRLTELVCKEKGWPYTVGSAGSSSGCMMLHEFIYSEYIRCVFWLLKTKTQRLGPSWWLFAITFDWPLTNLIGLLINWHQGWLACNQFWLIWDLGPWGSYMAHSHIGPPIWQDSLCWSSLFDPILPNPSLSHPILHNSSLSDPTFSTHLLPIQPFPTHLFPVQPFSIHFFRTQPFSTHPSPTQSFCIAGRCILIAVLRCVSKTAQSVGQLIS